MEGSVSAVKDQSSTPDRATSRLLRYPLRSASKSKEEKTPVLDSSNSVFASKRASSSVSKSVTGLHLSAKDKSARPPRRLSVPSKSNASPAPKSFSNITPISEARAKGTASIVSKSFSGKKLSDLSSMSYWLSHIKLCESAAMHSVSLGFFKLALEAGCEPTQKMSDELTSYVHRYNLTEPGELITELLESYKISESISQSKISEAGSQVSAEGNHLSDHDIHGSSSSVTDAEKLIPKSMDVGADEVPKGNKAIAVSTGKIDSVKKTRISVSKDVASSKAGFEARNRSNQKKPQKTISQEAPSTKAKTNKQGKKPAKLVKGSPKSEPEEALQENKENMDACKTDEVIPAEA